MIADHAALAATLLRACRLDVVAPKPGNVSVWSPGHGMTADNFLLSARVAAPALARAGASVGERIESAVAATWTAVGMNTNLGIVLLLAPLAHACELPHGSLRERLTRTLEGLSLADAECCFRAIRQAGPVGLGTVDSEDVAQQPASDLLTIMRLAARRDSIALQYATGYREIFERGLPVLREARQRWHSLAWAMVACYLRLMVEMPDTHVVRKHGERAAKSLQARAREVESALKACENPRRFASELDAFDRELKSGGVNPGTSADLTVASVAVLLLIERSL